ncbi:hypothetical protein [Haloprofundus halobius]|uniref:hypothetical protein n=1 Tax=Haloprofundus halobius TaxID=2876194 RepID=UPI001CCBA333|nr:hypothetical protein [Haloprofundus halobius]
MVDASVVVVQAIKVGYKTGGIRGAVVAGILAGGSVLAVVQVLRRYTDVEEEKLATKLDNLADDDELADILGNEFGDKLDELLTRMFSDRAGGGTGST